MSWLRNTSLSFARQLSRSLDPRHDYEPQACYNSFCKHWQQAYEIILKSQPSHLHDDVLSVVNHLEQLTTLVVLEARAREINNGTTASCLEYLLTENLLDKLYEWGVCTGKYENAVRLEELRLFGSLVSHYGSQVIAAEPFIRPLLKLLSGFRNELPPPNLENQLIKVLSQLCVALMQDMKFIDLFFLTTHTQNGSQAEFIIVRLLLPAVHRDGAAGSAARDALLLCAKMSNKSAPLAACLQRSNAAVVLATGLSGLYSLLPRTLGEKAYRLTSDDVIHVNKLTLFIDSLEFCNAVAEVAHPSIKKQLLDLLYQGFLVPVMGPALLQTKPGPLQSGSAEQAAATLYLELALRCASSRGLLPAVLRYLVQCEYDGVRVLDVLVDRLDGGGQGSGDRLSLVSLALMETLIDLNCEDVMIELVYKYLLNGNHLTVANRHKISDPETYREAATAFLSLSPKCCSWPIENTRRWVDDLALSGRRILDYKRDGDRKVNGVNGDIAMSNLVQEIRFNYGNPNETLYGNYHAYLCDARFEIVSRTIACSDWNCKYNTVTHKQETNNNSQHKENDLKEQDAMIQTNAKEQDSLISICTSGYDTLKTSVSSEKEPQSLTSLNENEDGKLLSDNNSDQHDSLTSLVQDNIDDERYGDDDGFSEDLFRSSLVKTVIIHYNTEVPTARNWRASPESVIGPLLSSLLKKSAAILESDITVNCRVTNALSKLATLPTSLLTSLLLCPSYMLPPNVPSLYQIVVKLRDEVDQLTEELDNPQELVDEARVFLMRREMALVKGRATSTDQGPQDSPNRQDVSPFKRENKRRSFSSSISSMFGRRLSSSTPQHITQNSPITFNASAQKRLNFTQEEYWNQSITHRSILNAVILDEWFKELAALCEEHALRLSAENYEDHTYLKTVAL